MLPLEVELEELVVTVELGNVKAGIAIGEDPSGLHDEEELDEVVLRVRINIPPATAAIITITAITTAVTVEIESRTRLRFLEFIDLNPMPVLFKLDCFLVTKNLALQALSYAV